MADKSFPLAMLRQGQAYHEEGRFEDAQRVYDGILNLDPGNPGVLYLRGLVAQQQGQAGLAMNLYHASLQSKPEYAQPWGALGSVLKEECQEPEALEAFLRAFKLYSKDGRHNDELANTYNNYATLFQMNNNPERCVYWCNRALHLRPGHAHAHWNKSLALLEMERFGEGWDEYEWGIATGGRKPKKYDDYADIPLWNGEPGKRVLVSGEQGVGDELMFASCLPDLERDAELVVLDGHPRLYPLHARSWDFPVFGTRKQGQRLADAPLEWVRDFDFDAKIPIGSLPRIYRRRVEDFPFHSGYIKVDPDLREDFRNRIGTDKPIIGVAWAGGSKKTRFDLRTFNPKHLMQALGGLDAHFLCLQYGTHAEGLVAIKWVRDIAEKHGLWYSENDVEDFDRFCSLVTACDLVITADQTLVHQCGALGHPCWALLPARNNWRYPPPQHGDTVRWYPDTSRLRLFRQPYSGAWDMVFRDVRTELQLWMEKHNA